MIVLDSSALVAIVNREPERTSFLKTIEASGGCFVSALTLLEARMVVRGRFGTPGLADLDALVEEMAADVVPFDAEQSLAAFAAFERFGRGMGAPARLNLGDCASYALAKSLGLPLLFKGDDFALTDIVTAV